MGSLKDLVIEGAGYANRALGALRILPDDAFRRLTAACGLAPDAPLARPLTADCSLCGLRMSENHIVTAGKCSCMGSAAPTQPSCGCSTT